MHLKIDIPTVLTIFGATGDLTKRKLLPSLYNLDRQGLLPQQFRIIAFARRDFTGEEYGNYIGGFIDKEFPRLLDKLSWEKFLDKITYISGDFTDKKAFNSLAKKLTEVDKELKVCAHKIFYLAISPNIYETVLNGIKDTSLKQICRKMKDSRVVIEKPFGSDLKSFRQLNRLVLDLFEEKQIYRIDHYLGKETVQNLLYFRAANQIFKKDWDKNSIESIDVNVNESLGVEDRASYYDKFGQLRDMVQSHMLQLLALIAVEVPGELDMSQLSVEKAKVISGLKILDYEKDIIRAQYKKGVVDGQEVIGYKGENAIPKNSDTETYVQLKAILDLPKWKGVKVNLITGKRMKEKATEVIVRFKKDKAISGLESGNKLVFKIQPKEGISLTFYVKAPGQNKLESVDMSFEYEDSFKTLIPEAYEKILFDIIRNNKVNFLSTEELEASWKFIDPIRKSWENESSEVKFYLAGSNKVE